MLSKHLALVGEVQDDLLVRLLLEGQIIHQFLLQAITIRPVALKIAHSHLPLLPPLACLQERDRARWEVDKEVVGT